MRMKHTNTPGKASSTERKYAACGLPTWEDTNVCKPNEIHKSEIGRTERKTAPKNRKTNWFDNRNKTKIENKTTIGERKIGTADEKKNNSQCSYISHE